MRNIFRLSQKQSDSKASGSLQETRQLDNIEQHAEPAGHVHDYYRHWVWLGLHDRSAR